MYSGHVFSRVGGLESNPQPTLRMLRLPLSKLFLLGVCLLCLSAPASLAVPVTNPGFETGNTSGWTCFGSFGADSVNKADGAFGLRLGAGAGASQTITGLSANTYYKFTAKIKTAAPSDVIIMSAKSYGNPQVSASTSAQAFTLKTLYFKTGPSSTAVTLEFYKVSLSAGNGYADTVTLDVAPGYVPPAYPTVAQANPDIDRTHPVTYKNWKGVTWDPHGLANGHYDANALNSDIVNMKYAGIHWVRLWIPQDHPLTALNQVCSALQSNGLQAYICFRKSPFAGNNTTYGTPAQEAATAAALTSFVNAQKTYVKHWEIHNEPSNSQFWNQEVGTGGVAVSAQKFKLHLQNCYNAIKAADPTAVVICGGIDTGVNNNWIPWFDALTAEQGYLYFDEFAFHPYAKNATPDFAVAAMELAKSKVAAWPAPHNNKPIWITEVGWTFFPDTDKEAYKAMFLYEAMPRLAATMKSVRPVTWWTLHETWAGYGGGITVRVTNNGVVSFDPLPALETMALVNDHNPLIENPGFEFGSILNWTGGYGSYAVDSANAANGSYGLRVSTSSGIGQTVNLFPNTSYTVSAMLKAAAGNTMSMNVQGYGGADLITSTTSTTYTAKSITFTTGPNTYGARINLYKGSSSGSGNGYADSVQIVKN